MTKKIPLTQGKFALVDDEDYDYLMQWKWHYSSEWYARRSRRKSETYSKSKFLFMHRIINKTPNGKQTDHINLVKLDNRKANLRSCTNTENSMNITVRESSKSGIKGVVWRRKEKKWIAQIKINKYPKVLGYFDNKEDAGKAYDRAAIKFFGKFARLNYPQESKIKEALEEIV